MPCTRARSGRRAAPPPGRPGARRSPPALGGAREAYKHRLLLVSAREAESAVAAAPKSRDALRLHSQVAKAMSQAAKLLKEARRRSARAEFDGAYQTLRELEAIQVDIEGLDAIKKELPKTRSAYDQAIEAGTRAKEARDLSRASRELKKALERCPASKSATSLFDAIRADQTRARFLIKEAGELIEAAQFKAAGTKLSVAARLWCRVTGLREASDTMTRKGREYVRCVQEAEQALRSRRLSDALEACGAALNACPESTGAKKLRGDIVNRQARARSALRRAANAWRAGEFEGAKKALKEAKTLWPKMELISNYVRRIPVAEEAYKSAMAKANTANRRRNFDTALEALDAALKTCPDSDAARKLKQETAVLKDENEKQLAQRRRRAAKRRERALGLLWVPFGGVAVVLSGVGIALFYVFWTCLSLALLIGLMPLAYTLDVFVSSFQGSGDVDLALSRGLWAGVLGMWGV